MKDRGYAAVELGLAVGLLLFPVALVVLGLGPWSERRVFAEAAAAEAARAAVIALDLGAGANVVAEMAANYGLASDSVRVGWCGGVAGELTAEPVGCLFSRGGTITARVEVWVPMISTPWGDLGGLWATAIHAEPIDPYRSLE